MLEVERLTLWNYYLFVEMYSDVEHIWNICSSAIGFTTEVVRLDRDF